MKSFVALFVLACVAGAYGLSEEQKAKGLEVMATCIAQESVTEDNVKQLKSGDFSNGEKNIRCFARCFMQGVGFMDADGNLLTEHIVEKLSADGDREKVQAAVDACKDLSDDDICEKAYKHYQCYVEHNAKLN